MYEADLAVYVVSIIESFNVIDAINIVPETSTTGYYLYSRTWSNKTRGQLESIVLKNVRIKYYKYAVNQTLKQFDDVSFRSFVDKI